MENYLKGTVGWKGERGYSAYEVALQNGFAGTEREWLSSLGTAEYLSRIEEEIIPTSTGTSFVISSKISKSDIVDVYVDGIKRAQDRYTIDTTSNIITFDTDLASGNRILLSILKARTAELPIVSTINDMSKDDTVPSAYAVYQMESKLNERINLALNEISDLIYVTGLKQNKESIQVVTGSHMNIAPGATAIVDINYPEGFTQTNTVILGKMVSSNNNYYDTASEELTASGFPIIKMIALTESTIRLWLLNTSQYTTKHAYYKITLMNTEHHL